MVADTAKPTANRTDRIAHSNRRLRLTPDPKIAPFQHLVGWRPPDRRSLQSRPSPASLARLSLRIRGGPGPVELGLPLLDPERGLLGPGLELLAHPPELLLGIAIGVEGIARVDRFVEVGIESLTIRFGGRSALVGRQFLRPRLRFGFQLR